MASFGGCLWLRLVGVYPFVWWVFIPSLDRTNAIRPYGLDADLSLFPYSLTPLFPNYGAVDYADTPQHNNNFDRRS
jgi:hypothetical protein